MTGHQGCESCTGLFELFKACPRYFYSPELLGNSPSRNFVLAWDLLNAILSVVPYFAAFFIILRAFWFKTARLFCLSALTVGQYFAVKLLKEWFKEMRPSSE